MASNACRAWSYLLFCVESFDAMQWHQGSQQGQLEDMCLKLFLLVISSGYTTIATFPIVGTKIPWGGVVSYLPLLVDVLIKPFRAWFLVACPTVNIKV